MGIAKTIRVILKRTYLKMKLLKTQRELGEFDFRKPGFQKVELTIIDKDEKTGGLIVEVGPVGARQKYLVPETKNKSLFEVIDDNDEVKPGAILHVEWLKDDSNGEGEFEVFYDDEKSPK